jgi:hypothetical protein
MPSGVRHKRWSREVPLHRSFAIVEIRAPPDTSMIGKDWCVGASCLSENDPCELCWRRAQALFQTSDMRSDARFSRIVIRVTRVLQPFAMRLTRLSHEGDYAEEGKGGEPAGFYGVERYSWPVGSARRGRWRRPGAGRQGTASARPEGR